jgi:hypothetical protein
VAAASEPRPTPPIANKDLAPDYVPSASTGWGNVTPFTLLSAAQFWLPGPPALTSEADALDYNEVKRLGGQVSEERTAEQAEIARFWFEGPQAWSRIARVVAEAWGLDAWDSARRPGGGCQGSAATCTSPMVAVGSRGCAA